MPVQPLKLPQPTSCCGNHSLIWITRKLAYECPCGTTRYDEFGKPIKLNRAFLAHKGKK